MRECQLGQKSPEYLVESDQHEYVEDNRENQRDDCGLRGILYKFNIGNPIAIDRDEKEPDCYRPPIGTR